MSAAEILDIVLDVFVWSNFPFNADWILGVWVGLNLLIHGIWTLAFL